eukprot:1154437-Pelagomonas_calceolata.AAC.2
MRSTNLQGLAVRGVLVSNGALVAEKALPASIKGKGDTLAQKCCESPPPRSYETENANGDLEGNWKQPAPEPVCEKYVFSILRLVVTSLLAYVTEWAWHLRASLMAHWWSSPGCLNWLREEEKEKEQAGLVPYQTYHDGRRSNPIVTIITIVSHGAKADVCMENLLAE